jgi:hypothetical protein
MSFSRVVRRHGVCLSTMAICWIAMATAAVYFIYDCQRTPSCSGEPGIVFFLLGLPWVFLLPQAAPPALCLSFSVFLNTLILGAVVQWSVKRLQAWKSRR